MLKLLIVDDEPLIRRGIKSLVDFDLLNIKEVREAKNGQEALEIFKDFKPHLVLADINMPKMDGLTFTEHAKAISPDVKIALVTGYDYFDYAVQALKLGVDDYVLKPISKKDIEEVLKKLIAKLEVKNTEEIVGKFEEENEIAAFLNDHQFEMDFSLKKLSDLMGYSSNHLSTLFKKKYGVTFQDYLLQVRIDKAKRLILTTSLKNYEIAEMVGFSDVNYFGTRFKKIVGMSPKQYKDQVRKGHD
ncbi:response regulator [Acidaminobacter sp. JC074]|uniref:response regulator transcription factor n=1 Tax=Acidaminobacter sp. JC074 TaxID=2530199 RepID=UPI001F102E38|nr:response regulator [Acidaminobacter sp. JC074]MCH4886736.1 response regulator [Acidaminobacter sp. JC074]